VGKKGPLFTALYTPAHLPRSLMLTGRKFQDDFRAARRFDEALSATEIEVYSIWPDGVSTAEIAASRSTSPQVIKNYTYRACQKLGADNRAHLIAVAFRRGLTK
jgi:DNA-binding CsgD family transcriptional regulator